MLASSARAEPAPVRILDDRADLDIMRAKEPKAFELFTQGEAALAAGRAAEASDLFARVQALWPSGAIMARRHCQALVELGKRSAAIEECRRAITNGGSFLDHRALVLALTTGDQPLKVDELADASRAAQSAKEHAPSLPYGYAAECDIARRLGDERMLRTCTEKLTEIAPDHYETRRALGALGAIGSDRLRVGFWLTLLAAGLATLVHAARRAFARRVATGATLVLLGLTFSHSSRADGPPPAASGEGGPGVPGVTKGFSKWGINHADPMSSVPTTEQRDANPLEYGYFLMDVTEAGDRAMQNKDYAAAAKYYQALAKAVPDAGRGFAKVCEAFEALGNRRKALEYCTLAIALRGVRLVDYGRYARVMLSKPEPLTPAEVAELAQVNTHLQSIEGGPDLAQSIDCEIGVRNEDVKRLQQCTEALQKTEPGKARTLTYQFAYAIARKDEGRAKQVIAEARQAALPVAAIQKMEASLSMARPGWRKLIGSWQFMAVLVAIAVAGACSSLVISRRRLRPQVG
jgi:tetratricopeptide (TPR) repeat protein